jgi:hypothetical protein
MLRLPDCPFVTAAFNLWNEPPAHPLRHDAENVLTRWSGDEWSGYPYKRGDCQRSAHARSCHTGPHVAVDGRFDRRPARSEVLAPTQPMDPMIVRYWLSSNAFRVVVRMLPPLAIEMASRANASSFGASMVTTMS